MQFIRYQTENRTLLSILFVSFLCLILISVSSFINAAAPLLIFGVPAAIWVKKTVVYGLAALTIWGTAEIIHKDLDEKIAALEKDIVRLTIEKQTAESAKKKAQTQVEEWKEKHDTAKTAVTTAETAVETATTAVSTAKANHKMAVYYEKWGYDTYMTHSADCRYCVGSSRCSDGQRLYDEWQAYKETTKANKATLDSAKTDLSNKKSDVSDARDNYNTVSTIYDRWKVELKDQTDNYDTAVFHLERKSKELVQRGIEKAIETATIQNAKGKTEWAIYTLQTAETNFPEAWREAMKDPDLAKQVKEVRDKWNAKNQETENGEQ